MDVTIIETSGLGDRSYLVSADGRAAVIDPQRDIDRILDLAREHGVSITHVLETHIHNDYVTGGLELARTLGAEYDQADGLKEVSAQRDVKLGDQNVNVQPSWMVKAQTARVKLMSRLGDSNKDSVSAQVDYATQGGAISYEVGYDRNLEDGRDVSATFNPDNKNLDIDYVDNKFEKGATWTASANVPLESGGSNNILDAAKVTLKRSWQW